MGMIQPIEKGVFRIVNIESGRCLFANEAENWEAGFGAGYPADHVGKDGLWKFCKHGGYWRIINAASGRCLYAAVGKNWEQRRGAGHPENAVGEDGLWKFSKDIPSSWFE